MSKAREMAKDRESRRKYNVRGDSWYALGDAADDDDDGAGWDPGPAAAAAGARGGRPLPLGGSPSASGAQPEPRRRGKGAVLLREDAASPATRQAPSTLEAGDRIRPHQEGKASELDELLDRFGRWGGLGLDAEVIESVFVGLGRDRRAASTALQEMAGVGGQAAAAASPAPGPTGARPAPAGQGSSSAAAEGGQGVRSCTAAGAGKAEERAWDPSLPEGADLWASLPADCQLAVLTSLDLRSLACLACACRGCCDSVRLVRGRVFRISVPRGLNSARAAGLVAAHPSVAAISFQPCSKAFTGFAPVFQAAATAAAAAAAEEPLFAPAEALVNPSPGSFPTAPGTGTRGLVSVTLSGCAHLTDSDVRVLLRLHPTLEQLDLSSCPLLTDDTLCALAEYPSEYSPQDEAQAGAGEAWEAEAVDGVGSSFHSSSADAATEAPGDLPEGTCFGDGVCSGEGSGGSVRWLEPGDTGQGTRALMRWRQRVGEAAALAQGVAASGRFRDPLALPLALARMPDGSTRLQLCGSSQPWTAFPGRAAAVGTQQVAGLQVLSVAGCEGMTDYGLEALLSGRHVRTALRVLDISRCSQMGPGLRRLPGRRSFLEKLTASSLPSLARALHFSGLSPRLQHLSLSKCTALPALTLHCTSLLTLSLDACSSLTHATLTCSQLQSLSLSHCKALTELSCEPCTALTSLRVAHCRTLGHEALLSVISRAQRLRELDCSCCDGLTSLELPQGSHPELRSLVLESCRGVERVVVHSPALEVFNLRRGRALTLVALYSPALRQVLLSNCSQLKFLRLDVQEIAEHLERESRGEVALSSGAADQHAPLAGSATGRGVGTKSSSSSQAMKKPGQKRMEIDVSECNLLPEGTYKSIKELVAIAAKKRPVE